MLDRAAITWIRERDVDLLLCSELHHAGPLRDMFERRLGTVGLIFDGAWVSHAELEGESDLALSWISDKGHVLVLVENKIAASFQPEQGERYGMRARRWAAQSGIARAMTLLVAPQDYLERPGVELFEIAISYEEMIEALKSDGDLRAKFLANTLQTGIASYRQGYVPVANEAVSEIWQALWDNATRTAARLRMQKPGNKPARSTWIYFREAEGFSAADRKWAVIVYKAERGQVDLQIKNTSQATLFAATGPYLAADMTVEKASKSAVIRITVPPIDFAGPHAAQAALILLGLRACERLRDFFETNSAHLITHLR